MVLVLGAAGMAAGIVLAIVLRGMAGEVPPPLASPSGIRSVHFSSTESGGDPNTHKRIAIEIRSANGEVEFRRQTRAHNLRTWSANWLDDDTLTLSSSEIGDLAWRRVGGAWIDDPGNGDRVYPPIGPAAPASGRPASPFSPGSPFSPASPFSPPRPQPPASPQAPAGP